MAPELPSRFGRHMCTVAGKLLDPGRRGGQAQMLQSGLSRLVVGQDEAIEQIVAVYQMYVAGMVAPSRPIGNFLFLGPTGSGKTRIVEALAETLLGDPRAVIKIDCAEFQHSHEIAKLIGSPPGYLGHRETSPALSQEALSRHHTDDVKITFVLFDEIEKASDALWNLLLGILDKATLTLGDNRRVDFSRTMVFMTGNLGAARMEALTRPGMGFSGPVSAAGLNEKLAKTGVEAARRRFTPEFINRIDKIVVFRPLGEPELRKVLEIELHAVQDRILGDAPRPFCFTLTDAAKTHLLREGTDARHGARHLKRAIERLLVQPLANLAASEQVELGDLVAVDYDGEKQTLLFVKRDEPAHIPAVAAAARPSEERKTVCAAARRPEPARAALRWPVGEVSFGE